MALKRFSVWLIFYSSGGKFGEAKNFAGRKTAKLAVAKLMRVSRLIIQFIKSWMNNGKIFVAKTTLIKYPRFINQIGLLIFIFIFIIRTRRGALKMFLRRIFLWIISQRTIFQRILSIQLYSIRARIEFQNILPRASSFSIWLKSWIFMRKKL